MTILCAYDVQCIINNICETVATTHPFSYLILTQKQCRQARQYLRFTDEKNEGSKKLTSIPKMTQLEFVYNLKSYRQLDGGV